MNRRSPSGPRVSWQDPVATFADLPLEGNEIGDARFTTTTGELWEWNGTAWVPPTGLGTDEKVKVTAADTTPDFLAPKIAAGANISLAVLNAGANEQLEISAPTNIWVKDPVATFSALPLVGNTTGDIRVTLDTGFAYVWDGTRWTSLGGANISQFERECFWVEDFLRADGTSLGDHNWASSTSGAGTNAVILPALVDGSHQGVISQQTGSTATGLSAVRLTGNVLSNVGAAGGRVFKEWQVNLEGPLSDGVNDYSVMYGYSDLTGVATGFGANAALLTHDPAVSLVNWVAKSIVGGVPTNTNTGIAITTAAWNKLGIIITSTGASYFVNGVLAASHAAAALPGATVPWTPVVKIQKTLGTAQRRTRTDYCVWGYRLSPPR
jgi:hypothetical protein